MRGGVLLSWSNFVALGDSLTAGKGDAGPGGHPVGWAQRLADVLSVRTAVRCTLTNMADDRATVSSVLKEQLPKVAAAEPDLVSVTVGMNDIRARGFDEMTFKSELGQLLEGLAATKAKVLTCTLPNIAAIMPLPPDLTEIARERMRLASDIIREQADSYEAVCLDAWSLPGLSDPELYSADKMHPNGKGHQFIAAAFADKLAPR
ncbi:MAG TPA: SGNH/GDSL hydrolase family protein [Streptosporangiaceae bacterium]|jgi:lysophospholipase L1-like esterase